MRIQRRELKTTRDWLEWQANRYAAAVLMPRRTFAAGLGLTQETMGVWRPGHLYVDDQPENISAYRRILHELAMLYRTSTTAIRIRLGQMALITDSRSQLESGRGSRPGAGAVTIREALARLLGG